MLSLTVELAITASPAASAPPTGEVSAPIWLPVPARVSAWPPAVSSSTSRVAPPAAQPSPKEVFSLAALTASRS